MSTVSMRRSFVACLRGARLFGHVCAGVLAAMAINVSGGRLRAEPVARWWSLRALRILNIELQVHGERIDGGRVVVANHVSWLDIPLLAAAGDSRFVAKSEIRTWPVAGWMANAAGTFYIRRGKGGARPLLERLVPHLISGGGVTLFPEGTTTDGTDVLPFHARLFAAAVESGACVQPVALRYSAGAGGRLVAPFIGDDDLLSHILRLLREPGLRAEVSYLPGIDATTMERDELAKLSHERICEALRPRAQTDSRASRLPERLAA